MRSIRFNFFYLIISTFIISFFLEELLDFNNIYRSSLAERLTFEQIENVIVFQNKWKWIKYFIIPIFLLIKTGLIAFVLDAGCFFFNKEVKYKQLFNIVVKAEFVFLLVIIFKTLWFYVFQQDYTLEDLQYFYPLSAINITGYEGLQPWFVYPLQVLNLFELAYWGILAYLLGKTLKISTNKGLSIVAGSYGVGLLIWVVAVMFLTLNVT